MISLTDQMIYRLGNLNTEQQRISYQMSTGKLLDKGSDDSSIFARELYVNDKVRTYEGLQTQIQTTTAQNSVSDSSLAEVKTILDNIKQEISKALNPGMDANDKIASAVNIEGMKENLLTLMNTRVNGEYIFAGANSSGSPFSKDSSTGKVSYEGDDSLKSIAVEPNTYRDKGVNGFDVMFYDKDIGNITNDLDFTLDERILDDDGSEWHLSEATTGHALTFDIDDVIKETTVPSGTVGTSGNQWVLSEATLDHKLTFDAGDSGSILDNNGVSWTLNAGVPQLEKTGGTATGVDAIAVTSLGGDIYETTANLSSYNGITELSIGTLRLREIDSNDMTSTPSISVTNIEGNKYKTSEILSTTVNNAATAVAGFTTTDGGSLTLRHFDNNGTVVTADTKTPVSVSAPTDASTGLIVREYKLDSSLISTGEEFSAKHNIFDDVDLVINALNTNTNETTDSTNGPVGLKETLALLDNSYDAANIAHSKLGGRNKIFELSLSTVSSKLVHFNILSQEVGGADLGKVAMEAKALELTFTALYSTITQMNSLSLVNFIR